MKLFLVCSRLVVSVALVCSGWVADAYAQEGLGTKSTSAGSERARENGESTSTADSGTSGPIEATDDDGGPSAGENKEAAESEDSRGVREEESVVEGDGANAPPDDEAVSSVETASSKPDTTSPALSDPAIVSTGSTTAEEPEREVGRSRQETEESPEPRLDSPQESAGEEHSFELLPTGFIPSLRVGTPAAGWTKVEVDCEESGALACGSNDIEGHAESSGVGVALDALYAPVGPLRLGANLHWTPTVRGDAGSDTRWLGMGFALQGVLEGALPLMDGVALTARVQGGGAALVPKSFTDDLVAEAQGDCDEARAAGIDCTIEDGPYLAATYGGGAGMLWQTELGPRLRVDLVFQTQKLRIYRQEASSAAGSIDATLSLRQNQFWLFGGVEI